MEPATPGGTSARKSATLSITGMSCASCVDKIEKRVGGMSGVSSVAVRLTTGKALVEYDPREVNVATIVEAVRRLGYDARESLENNSTSLEENSGTGPKNETLDAHHVSLTWPLLMGFGGFVLLGLFYLGIVGGTSRSLSHAFELLSEDAPLVIAIAVGFGIQMGLYGYLRKSLRAKKAGRSSTAIAASGTGTSTVSMIACCAHHVADFLPLLGLASAGAVISEYRIPLMSLGLMGNGIGIVLMIRLIWRVRRGECCVDRDQSREATPMGPPPLGPSRQPIP